MHWRRPSSEPLLFSMCSSTARAMAWRRRSVLAALGAVMALRRRCFFVAWPDLMGPAADPGPCRSAGRAPTGATPGRSMSATLASTTWCRLTSHEAGKWTVRYTSSAAKSSIIRRAIGAAQPARPVSAETARAMANNVSHSATLSVHCRDAQRRACPRVGSSP
jgi:hypothetical protein